MKIILDTNVFISGIFWSGSPHQVVALWALNKIHLIVTKKILSEYLHILHKIDSKGDIAKKWGTFVLENSQILEDKELVKICRDTEDNKFLNCAIIGRADYLVSGDDDLLCLKKIGSTKIITPSKFLKIHGKQR
ncbi:putative toxin-antitoxin system toxin component, PIN family [Candidatus Peregrinibacteria bacterium]|nr:putative toxin-antitoxin system toxin component, PIN family [Candidatus Peregrinibacteria bacterium]